METVFTKADELVGTVKEYVNARVDLLKLEAAEKTAGMVAGMMARTIVAVVFLCFFCFCGNWPVAACSRIHRQNMVWLPDCSFCVPADRHYRMAGPRLDAACTNDECNDQRNV